MREFSRRGFLKLTAAAGALTAYKILSGCSYLESLPQTQTRDELFDWFLSREGINLSERERNLWLTDFPLEKWDPELVEEQQMIVEYRLQQLVNTKLNSSQNPHFKQVADFLTEQDTGIEFTISRPGETTEDKTQTEVALAEDGEINYQIKLSLSFWRSNDHSDGGVKDIDLAFQLVHEIAHVKYFRNLEVEGVGRGFLGKDLFEFLYILSSLLNPCFHYSP